MNFARAGLALPGYDITQASEELRARILGDRKKIIVQHGRAQWENLLGEWENEAPRLHLEVKGEQQSTDGIWRVPADERAEIELSQNHGWQSRCRSSGLR